jgi:hypothetical protein
LKITTKVHGALQSQDLLHFRLNAKVPKRRLIERLHALRCHCDLHTVYLEQSHGTKINIAITGDRSGGPDFTIAFPKCKNSKRERRVTFWQRIFCSVGWFRKSTGLKAKRAIS